MAEGIKTSEMRELLRKRFGNHARYAVAEEVGDSTGFARRRLDMVVCSCWESDGFCIEGIEIKVSKSDLKHELENPHKHDVFFGDLDFYSLAAPREVINGMSESIPKTWGLYEAYRQKDGELALKCRRRPVSIEGSRSGVSRNFFASLVRHLYACSPENRLVREAEQRGYEKGLKDGPDRNRWRIESLERDLNDVPLYDVLDRVSCWCCRNKNLKELRAIHDYLPGYWERLVAMEQVLGPMKKGKTLPEIGEPC